jgi:CRP-like cAMP-binding protein
MKSTATTRELLCNVAVFGGLSASTLDFILDQAPVVTITEDEYFFRENESGSSMFVLQTGKVGVIKTRERRRYLLRSLMPGDCFGEMALIDPHPRSASVVALEDCTALEISTGILHRLYTRDLEQLTIVYMNMAREVSRRLRDADEQLFSIQLRNDEG